MSKTGKFPIQWIGRILMATSAYFVIKTLIGLDVHHMQVRLEAGVVIGAVVSFLVLHAINMLAQTYAWKLLLDFIGEKPVVMSDAIPVFMKSNIAKYLPGNMFEFVSRNVLGSKYGWRHSHMVLSSVFEILLALVIFCSFSALLIALEALPLPLDLAGHIDRSRLSGIVALAAAAGIAGATITWHVGYARPYLERIFSKAFSIFFAKFFSVQLFLFVINSALFLIVFIPLISGTPTLHQLTYIAGAFLMANFAGYIIPGAPGGIGIREAALIHLLAPAFGEGPTVMAALSHRILSIAGDIVAYGMGVMVEKSASR